MGTKPIQPPEDFELDERDLSEAERQELHSNPLFKAIARAFASAARRKAREERESGKQRGHAA